MSVDGIHFQKQPITLRPREGNANFYSVISGGNLTFDLGRHTFLSDNSYYNFTLRILHGGIDNYPGQDTEPDTLLDYLDPESFHIEDLKKTIPEDYLYSAGLLGGEYNDQTIVTRALWKQLLTMNGQADARGGFFTKYATNVFQRIQLESPGIGVIELDENLEFTGMFRAFEKYTDRLKNMTTFYFSSRAREVLMGYTDIENKYYGFELEIRIPLSILIGSLNNQQTNWILSNDDQPVRQIDFFPGIMFNQLLLNMNVKKYDRFLNFQIYNSLGMSFYLNRYLRKHPPFYLMKNQVSLDSINTAPSTAPEFRQMFLEGNGLVIQKRQWEFGGRVPFNPIDIGTTRTISNLGTDNYLKSYGILFTTRDHFELFTNPNVRTFQIQLGSDQTNRVPLFEARDSIPEFWDEYLQVALQPLNNPFNRIDDEYFNWFFSGLTKQNVPIEGSPVLYHPCEWFPLIMNLQGGDFVGPEKHFGTISFLNQFENPQEGIKRRLPGAGEYPIMRYFGQFMRTVRIAYDTDGVNIAASTIMNVS